MKYLSEKAAAKFLDRTRQSLKLWRMAETGPRYYRDGHGRIRYKLNDLEEWIKSGGEGGGTDAE